jgi:hypothetical protein
MRIPALGMESAAVMYVVGDRAGERSGNVLGNATGDGKEWHARGLAHLHPIGAHLSGPLNIALCQASQL